MRIILLVLFSAMTLFGDVVDLKLVSGDYFREVDLSKAGAPKIKNNGGVLEVTFNNECRLTCNPETNEIYTRSPEGVVLFYQPPKRAMLGLKRITGKTVEALKISFKLVEVLLYGESLCLNYEFSDAEGTQGTARWYFRPVKSDINHKIFTGLQDHLEIVAPGISLHELTMLGLTAWGDDYKGARSFRLACYPSDRVPGYKEVAFGKDPANLGSWGSTIDGGQVFHVIGLERGTFYEYLDDEAHDSTLMEKNNQYGGVDIKHTLLLGRIPGYYMSPGRCRLFSTERLSPQLWIELQQSRRNYFQKKYEIKPTTIRPIIIYRNFWYKTSFLEAVNKVLPQFESMGFRRCEIGWIYERGIAPLHTETWATWGVYKTDGKLATWRAAQTEKKDTVMSTYGGQAALRRFVDAAHQRKIEVYVWHQTAHGWRGDEIFRNHPDWMIYGLDGQLSAGTYKESLTFLDLNSGFLAYTLNKIRQMKDSLAIDGVWLDMYGAGVYGSVNYAKAIAYPGMASRQEYTRQIRNMGLGIYGEGMQVGCIDSYELQPSKDWDGHEFVLYASSPIDWRIMSRPDGLDYFKLLSFQCMPTDTAYFLEKEQPLTPEMNIRMEELRYRNKVFNMVEDQLGPTPLGLVINELGTQWVMTKGNVFFFTKAGAIALPLKNAKTKVVTLSPAGKIEHKILNGVLHAEVPVRGVIMLRQS